MTYIAVRESLTHQIPLVIVVQATQTLEQLGLGTVTRNYQDSGALCCWPPFAPLECEQIHLYFSLQLLEFIQTVELMWYGLHFPQTCLSLRYITLRSLVHYIHIMNI